MNRFYDLPVEIINKIYNMDNTYKEIYDKVVRDITTFPVFCKIEKEYYIFIMEYNVLDEIPVEEYLSVSKNYSYKKSIFIIIEKMLKPNTLISNHVTSNQEYYVNHFLIHFK